MVGMFDMDPSDGPPPSNGHPSFDPRKRSFSEEELKPQPMIKKARKILVPDNMKVSFDATVGEMMENKINVWGSTLEQIIWENIS